MKRLLTRSAALAAVMGIALLGLIGPAQAALISRGGGLIYDTTRNLTWMADMQYAKTSGFVADGRMTWYTALQWTHALVFGGGSDWRLPTASEIDTLFTDDLGNQRGQSVLNQVNDTAEQRANLALFTHVITLWGYWSSTESPLDPDAALGFAPMAGYPSFEYDKRNAIFAMAVHDGDLGATVPEPASLGLAAWALLAMARLRRRPGR